jgi:hypothetical protein
MSKKTSIQKKRVLLDIVLLVLFPILAAGLSLLFHANFLLSILFFYGIPGIYLSIRTPHAVVRALIFSGFFSLLALPMADHLAVMDHAWFVPTIFPFRVFGTVPVEDIIWAFFMVYFIVMFYDHFFDKGKHAAVNPHLKLLAYFVVAVLVCFLLKLAWAPQSLSIAYSYLWINILLCLLPVVAFLVKFPALFSKFMKTAPYFLFFGLTNELTALQLGHWTFPGHNFIGWVTIFNYAFPFEEFFLLMIIGCAILTYFEFFDDTPSHLSQKE